FCRQSYERCGRASRHTTPSLRRCAARTGGARGSSDAHPASGRPARMRTPVAFSAVRLWFARRLPVPRYFWILHSLERGAATGACRDPLELVVVLAAPASQALSSLSRRGCL